MLTRLLFVDRFKSSWIEKFKKVMLLLTFRRVYSINKIANFVNSQANQTSSNCHMDHTVSNILYGPYCMDHGKNLYKGSPYLSHFNLDINVGKKRIRHWTTLNFNDVISIRFWVNLKFRNSSQNFRVVAGRFRIFPTFVSNIKWLWSELPLKFSWQKISL